MTTYLALYARDQLDEAQRIIDTHVTSGPAGCCRACGRPEPCPARVLASGAFARYRQLPRRRAGLALWGVR